MPKRGRSVWFFPRPSKKEDAELGPLRHISVDYEVLESLFHLNLKDAARKLGLCITTFKKACRRFHLAKWPRKAQRDAAIARRNARTNGVDAAIRTLHQEPVGTPTTPTPQTTEVHYDKRAVAVSCTSPVWHDESDAWRRDASGLCFAISSNASSSSTACPELHRDWPDPFGAVISSAAPEGLLQQASVALDTRSCGETRHAGPAFQHKTLSIDSLEGSICIGVPMPEDQPTTGPYGALPPTAPHQCPAPHHERGGTAGGGLCGGEQGSAEAGPPRERSCIEAVMAYLDGPLAGNFDFMFADEEWCAEIVGDSQG